ncbi:Inosose dehydratase [Calidithermus terrae]|uniref:Inosose dehydratase n=1 Tax=Calidithermus terrae TaxID=1408545 RepID=A0A399F2H5_9DEIN|nr:sugar phosphate isomerase/epimerase [Calidithermus terrae]RIH90283.1 Inosose dehydratase [Calidithermus terrae]
MNRRRFLQGVAATALAAKGLGRAQNTPRPRVGLQLYTLRDLLGDRFKETLEQVAAMGYEGVEFAGVYGGLNPGELRRFLDGLGLETAGLHVPLEQLEQGLDGQVALARALGTPYLVCPWLDAGLRGSEARWRELFGRLERLGKACRAAGVRLVYHNHEFEFEEKVGGRPAFDALFAAAPSLEAELDVAWAHAGGQDPAAYVRKYAGRLPLVHLKDLKGRRTVELGRGEVPVEAAVRAAQASGVRWLLVEQDESARPLESVRASLEWLRSKKLV